MTNIAYELISDHYGDKCAKRSKVRLMNHIDEGIAILQKLGADESTIDAYTVHPLFQDDSALESNEKSMSLLSGDVMGLVMEYRRVANDFLPSKISKYNDDEIIPDHSISLSPLTRVNTMLIADKVQNRKDFLLYNYNHERSDELDYYFKYWLSSLGVSEEQYNRLIHGI